MKRIIFSLAALLFIAVNVQAQQLHLGIKAGANMGKIDGHSFNEKFELAYHVGGYLNYDFNEKIGIQPEVLYSQVQTRTATGDLTYDNLKPDTKAKLDYLSIPILLNYNVMNILTLQAGPQFSVLVNQDKNFLENSQDAFKSNNTSAVLGVQLNLNNFKVYGRYNIGLQNINDLGDQEKWRSQMLQVGLGYNIF